MPPWMIESAADRSIHDLADLLTRGFEGYVIPLRINASALHTLIRRDGIDLTVSRVLLKEEEPIGLALLARRGWTSRLAAMGIVCGARQQGAGTWAMERILEEARARGEKRMVLEVIEQNSAGVKLYRKLGFETVRRLAGYRLENPQAGIEAELQEADIRELGQMVTAHGLPDLPWQLSGETIAQHTPPSRAFRLGEAWCLISDPAADHITISCVLVKSGSRGAGGGSRLMRALFSKFPGKTWHMPAIYPEEMGSFFEKSGMQREAVSQWQMDLVL